MQPKHKNVHNKNSASFDMNVKSRTVWDQIKTKLNEIELYEAKSMIGYDLVDQIEGISSEIESFSGFARLTSVHGECDAHLNKFGELNDDINKSIDDFVNQFQTKSTTTCENILIAELEQMKRKLENLQNLVLFNLTGRNPIQNDIDGPEKSVENKVDDLEYNLNAAREFISRLNHKCDRCSNRKPLSASLSQSPLQSQLDSLILSDDEIALDSEIEPKYSEEEAGRRLQMLCRSNSGDVLAVPDSLSSLPSPTPKWIPGNIKSLTPSQSSTVFKRSSSLTRLAPLKLRPTVKHGIKRSRSKDLGNKAGDEGKSPVTSLHEKFVSKNISNCNSALSDSRKLPSLRPLKALDKFTVNRSAKKAS